MYDVSERLDLKTNKIISLVYPMTANGLVAPTFIWNGCHNQSEVEFGVDTL